jgi:hypothetical protein
MLIDDDHGIHPRTAMLISTVSRSSIGLTIAISLLVLAGWVWDVEWLKSILHPSPKAMSAAAASLWR